MDAVLVTFPDIPHIGALPYAYGHLGLTAPAYGVCVCVCVCVCADAGTSFAYSLWGERVCESVC